MTKKQSKALTVSSRIAVPRSSTTQRVEQNVALERWKIAQEIKAIHSKTGKPIKVVCGELSSKYDLSAASLYLSVYLKYGKLTRKDIDNWEEREKRFADSFRDKFPAIRFIRALLSEDSPQTQAVVKHYRLGGRLAIKAELQELGISPEEFEKVLQKYLNGIVEYSKLSQANKLRLLQETM